MLCIAVLVAVLGLANGALIRPIPLTDGRIVGGQNVTIDDFPYQVSLQYLGYHICGGTILSPTRVLTAAHCTIDFEVVTLSVRAGSSIRGSGGEVVNVTKVVHHKSYNIRTMDFDLSVLSLASALTLGSPASLATYVPSNGTPVVVSGWGVLTEGGSLSTTLQAVLVNIVDEYYCDSAYAPRAITDRMICAAANGKDSCQGDSGGPLVLNGTTTLLGVVSFGYGCAQSNYPGVYASVPNMRAWIETEL